MLCDKGEAEVDRDDEDQEVSDGRAVKELDQKFRTAFVSVIHQYKLYKVCLMVCLY